MCKLILTQITPHEVMHSHAHVVHGHAHTHVGHKHAVHGHTHGVPSSCYSKDVNLCKLILTQITPHTRLLKN